jgi:hypothetical protein
VLIKTLSFCFNGYLLFLVKVIIKATSMWYQQCQCGNVKVIIKATSMWYQQFQCGNVKVIIKATSMWYQHYIVFIGRGYLQSRTNWFGLDFYAYGTSCGMQKSRVKLDCGNPLWIQHGYEEISARILTIPP